MTHTLHPLAEDYLERLDRAATRLPPERRSELVDDIEAHLNEALGPEPTDAHVLNVLDRLGTPEEIVEAEAPQPEPIARPKRSGLHEGFAVFLLLFGGFLFGVGWFAGLILLWTSRAWTTIDKAIGIFAIPGGLAMTAAIWTSWGLMGDDGRCVEISPGAVECGNGNPGWEWIPLIAVLIIPIVTAIYLVRRADLTRAS